MGKKFSLKSIFVVDAENPAADSAQTPPQPQGAAVPVAVRGGSDQPAAAPVAGGIEDSQIRESLLKSLEDANQSGYDYFEFAQAVEQQKKFVEAEQIRFQTTHAAASVMGVTPDTLIASARQYLTVLADKEKEFLQALNQNLDLEVGKKKKDIIAVDAQITSKTEAINRLSQEIGDLHKKKVQLETEANASALKIESIRLNFNTTMQSIAGKISSDIEKIKQYLAR
jgi:hypothetical protein